MTRFHHPPAHDSLAPPRRSCPAVSLTTAKLWTRPVRLLAPARRSHLPQPISPRGLGAETPQTLAASPCLLAQGDRLGSAFKTVPQLLSSLGWGKASQPWTPPLRQPPRECHVHGSSSALRHQARLRAAGGTRHGAPHPRARFGPLSTRACRPWNRRLAAVWPAPFCRAVP